MLIVTDENANHERISDEGSEILNELKISILSSFIDFVAKVDEEKEGLLKLLEKMKVYITNL